MKTEFLNLRSLKPERILEYEIKIKLDRSCTIQLKVLKLTKT